MQKYETARKLIFLAFVRDSKYSYLLKYAVSCELHLAAGRSVEVMNSHGCDLHYIPNV